MVDNTVKATLIKLHEYAHTKFKGNTKLNISPKYLLKDNLDYFDDIKKIEDENKMEDPEIMEFLGELDQTIERYIFGDELLINNIIYYNEKYLSQLYKSELYTKNNFNEVNKLAENFKSNNKEQFNDRNRQTKIRTNQNISIPKLDIKKYGRAKIYTYYNLNISSTDLI